MPTEFWPPVPPREPDPPVPPIPAELAAADHFRVSLLCQKDGEKDGHAWWYGWALVQAFQAGARWQRMFGG